MFWRWRAQLLQTAEWCSSSGSQLKRWQGGDRRALVDQYVNTGLSQIELPSRPVPALRTGALAVCRCYDDIRVARQARNDGCGHAGIQISRPRPTHDSCGCLLTPNFARSQRIPLFVCAPNRNATGGEQRCSWVKIGLSVSQTYFGTAFVLGGRQVSPSTMWHACVRPSDRYFLVYISTHKESLGKVTKCAHNREDTGLK